MTQRRQFLESIDRVLREEADATAVLQLFEEYNVGKDAFLAFEACSKVLEFGAVESFLKCIEGGYAVDLKDKRALVCSIERIWGKTCSREMDGNIDFKFGRQFYRCFQDLLTN